MNMETANLGDGLGKRRRRRRKHMGALPTLVGRRRGRKGRRKGRKICIRTAAGKKACGVRWRKRRK
jgi:hypothetical protein